MAENENGNGKKKKTLSPEARERLSQLAKQRHKEGKFGGAEFGKLGGRPRKPRAAELVAQAAQEEANAIIEVFKDAIHVSQPMSVRLKAAEAWLGVEREQAKLLLQEADHDSKTHSREELIAMLSKNLTEGPAAHIIQRQIAQESGITDVEVVDDAAA